MSSRRSQDALINATYDLGRRSRGADSATASETSARSQTGRSPLSAVARGREAATSNESTLPVRSAGSGGAGRSGDKRAESSFFLAYPQSDARDANSYYASKLSSPQTGNSTSVSVLAKPVDSVLMQSAKLPGQRPSTAESQPIVNPDYSGGAVVRSRSSLPSRSSTTGSSTQPDGSQSAPVRPGGGGVRRLPAERDSETLPSLEERLQRYRSGSDSYSLASSREQNYAARPASLSSFHMGDASSSHPPSPATARSLNLARPRRAGLRGAQGVDSKWLGELESQLQKAVQVRGEFDGFGVFSIFWIG